MGALTISSIELNNFMCHRHFFLSFARSITCIGGRNGTGKSAVMIALGIIFGQRAQALERGSSLAGLIRTGCNQAVIRVTINNHLKFHAEKYGEEIVIEKKLRASGSRLGFQKDGRLANMSVQELRDVLNAYGLRFENPLNFLTQEKSKRFLMAAGPGELYDFYYRGSEFKTINEELEEGIARLQEMEEKLRSTADEYERVNGELEVRQENLRFLSTNYEAELGKLEEEEMVLGLKKAIDDINECEAQIGEKRGREQELRRKAAAQRDELGEMGFVPQSTADVDMAIEDMILKQRSLENDCAEYRKEQEEVEAAIQAIKARCMLDDCQNEQARISHELARSDAEIATLEGRDGVLALQAETEKARNRELADKRYALGKQIAYLRANAQDAQTKSLVDQYRRVKDMMRSTSFTDEVIGPLCDYISLREPKWCKPASLVLKRSLSAFIVFNRRDRQLLSDIFKKAGANFPISLLSSKRVVGGLCTVKNSLLDVLDLRRDIVLNQLVMFHNVEQIMLVEKREDAYQIIKSGSVDGCSRTIECAYTLGGEKVKLTNGSLSDYKARDAGRYWFEDNTTRIKSLEQALKSISLPSSAQDELDRNGVLLREAHGRKRELEAAKGELEARISSMADLNENSTEAHERRLAVLRRNVDILQTKMEEYRKRLEAENARKHNIGQENAREQEAIACRRDEQSRKIDQTSLEIAQHEATILGLIAAKKTLLRTADDKLKAILERDKTAETGKAACQPCGMVACKEEEPENKQNCRTGKGSAQSVAVEPGRGGSSPPISGSSHNSLDSRPPNKYRGYDTRLPEGLRGYLGSQRTTADVEREKRAVKNCARQARKLRSKEDIEKEIALLVRERNMHKRICERFERMTRETLAACEKRIAKREEIKGKKTIEAAELFREFTLKGGYEGELSFDHENRRLDLTMRVHRLEVAGSKATLSGGERSFAGVCFLLSLWKSFRCPVKVLDEFDVFMDAINRGVAMRTLFDFFKRNEMQVILITPLSTEELADDECEIRVLSKELE